MFIEPGQEMQLYAPTPKHSMINIPSYLNAPSWYFHTKYDSVLDSANALSLNLMVHPYGIHNICIYLPQEHKFQHSKVEYIHHSQWKLCGHPYLTSVASQDFLVHMVFMWRDNRSVQTLSLEYDEEVRKPCPMSY